MNQGFGDDNPNRPRSRPEPSGRPVFGAQGSEGKLRGPKPLSDILADLFAARGLARIQAVGELETAWATAIGEPGCNYTRVEHLRRGILTVTVGHPTLLAELASFQKPNLLASMRRLLSGTPIHDIRFRVGPISGSSTSESPRPSPSPKSPRRRI